MENASEENTAELLTLHKETNLYGAIRYYNNEHRVHRIHGPAVIYADGSSAWYQNGKLHREDGPAFEHTNGITEWWEHGRFIRRSISRTIKTS